MLWIVVLNMIYAYTYVYNCVYIYIYYVCVSYPCPVFLKIWNAETTPLLQDIPQLRQGELVGW